MEWEKKKKRNVNFGEMLVLLFVTEKSGHRDGHILLVYFEKYVYIIDIFRCKGLHEYETLLALVSSVHFLL